MSIHAMTLVWRCTDMSQSETLVALALADHANDQGICWPSLHTIAIKSRLSERQVRRVIQKLQDDGIVVYNEKPGRSHTYCLDLHWLRTRGDMVSGVGVDTPDISAIPRTQ
jgi:MarR-like DNA-binding transcriptional regulator SgrR of sgrS sRNA